MSSGGHLGVFIYEFITGGGSLERHEGPMPPSLLREGRAMLAAVARDFAQLDGVTTRTLWDHRLADDPARPLDSIVVDGPQSHRRAFLDLAASCDWTLVIAPETDGALARHCALVEESGGRLLGPPGDVVRIASDKQTTADYLSRRGVPVPAGIALAPGSLLPAGFDYPAVLKPRDGAGSQGVRLVTSPGGSVRCDAPARLEQYCPGQAASVALLCGPGAVVALAPCRQHLSDDGTFTYLGGSLPLESDMAARARDLALAALRCLPGAAGYLGVDLVLGQAADGSRDVVIEINPRLTTSYVGLRAAANCNLAAAMLSVARGEELPIAFGPDRIEFTADGQVRRLATR